MNAAADENPWAAALKRKTSSGNEDGERPPRTRARHSWSRTSEKHAGPRVAVGMVQGEGRNGGEEEELPMQTKHRKQADNSSPHSPGAVTTTDCGEDVAGRPEHSSVHENAPCFCRSSLRLTPKYGHGLSFQSNDSSSSEQTNRVFLVMRVGGPAVIILVVQFAQPMGITMEQESLGKKTLGLDCGGMVTRWIHAEHKAFRARHANSYHQSVRHNARREWESVRSERRVGPLAPLGRLIGILTETSLPYFKPATVEPQRTTSLPSELWGYRSLWTLSRVAVSSHVTYHEGLAHFCTYVLERTGFALCAPGQCRALLVGVDDVQRTVWLFLDLDTLASEIITPDNTCKRHALCRATSRAHALQRATVDEVHMQVAACLAREYSIVLQIIFVGV
ncbi:hypothetical protein FVE85_0062 [Porphyridium purpureum]|uniref:Uncharacterized protein n=1 Tax=Porphyridium purpureum TaxID=35688 RepID=A0A5J4Z0I3_PORPP|nr:hypothetical protein FVE85_0062 [Porphyridium purpureum]|eukprot:POR7610..scf208_2